ncbi:DUF805 domain-containing protein [Mesorhizobium sp. ZMM04-4]
MRGEVIHYDEAQGFGFISGSDGNRYTFRREDLRPVFAVSKGASVEFRDTGGQARAVSPVSAEATPTPASLTATPIATPTTAPAPRRYGRDAVAGAPAAIGLWGAFRNAITVNHVNFRDRATRKEYWGFCLFWLLFFSAGLVITLFLDDSSGNFDMGSDLPAFSVGFAALFILATFLPGLAVTIRRIHDIGLAGWFYLLVFLPYVGWLIILVFALIPSQKRENRWGPAPAGAGG